MKGNRLDPDSEVKFHGVLMAEGGRSPWGWVHTHGMAEHDMPELEVFVSPAFMIPQGFDLLDKISKYMLNGGSVESGDSMKVGEMEFKLVAAGDPPLDSMEWHYEYPVLRLVDGDPPPTEEPSSAAESPVLPVPSSPQLPKQGRSKRRRARSPGKKPKRTSVASGRPRPK